MKRVGNLWNQVVDLDNLALAAHKAFRGKEGKGEVVRFRAQFTEELQRLRQEILTDTMDVGDYHYFTIRDPKERLICAASLRIRILHHALMNVCHEYFDRRLIYDTYATRPGKGSYAALDRAKDKMKQYPYYVKLDVRKYYDSIDHRLLKKQLSAIFKDANLQNLFYRIIDSYAVSEEKGLPIGNLTSQYFANLYLSGLDHYMKEQVGAKVYIRYMDDVLMMGESRARLKEMANCFTLYADRQLQLKIKPPQIGRCSSGVSFLGYRVFPGYLQLNGRSKRRFRSKLLDYHQQLRNGVLSEDECAMGVVPMLAFLGHAKSYHFRRACMKILGDV
jgi:retron-type reverse transcriptase